MYTRPLKVCRSNNEQVVAIIHPHGNNVTIKIGHLPEVEKDNPKFAEKGRIKITCLKSKYKEAIKKLTAYLESLFLKELENEDIHTSVRTNNVKRGNVEKSSAGNITENKGKGNSAGVHTSTRGIKSTESSAGGESTSTEMDESSDPSASPEGEKGN